MPWQITPQTPVEVFVQQDTHQCAARTCALDSSRNAMTCSRFTLETLEKLLDRISRFQVIEQALRRHTRARKHRLATEHLRILRDDAAHGEA